MGSETRVSSRKEEKRSELSEDALGKASFFPPLIIRKGQKEKKATVKKNEAKPALIKWSRFFICLVYGKQQKKLFEKQTIFFVLSLSHMGKLGLGEQSRYDAV